MKCKFILYLVTSMQDLVSQSTESLLPYWLLTEMWASPIGWETKQVQPPLDQTGKEGREKTNFEKHKTFTNRISKQNHPPNGSLL